MFQCSIRAASHKPPRTQARSPSRKQTAQRGLASESPSFERPNKRAHRKSFSATCIRGGVQKCRGGSGINKPKSGDDPWLLVEDTEKLIGRGKGHIRVLASERCPELEGAHTTMLLRDRPLSEPVVLFVEQVAGSRYPTKGDWQVDRTARLIPDPNLPCVILLF